MNAIRQNMSNMLKNAYRSCTFTVKCHEITALYNNGLFQLKINKENNKPYIVCNTDLSVPYVDLKRKFTDCDDNMFLEGEYKYNGNILFHNNGVIPIDWIKMFLRYNEYQNENSLVLHDIEITDSLDDKSDDYIVELYEKYVNSFIAVPKSIEIYKSDHINKKLVENRFKHLGLYNIFNNGNSYEILKNISMNSSWYYMYDENNAYIYNEESFLKYDNDIRSLGAIDLQTVVILNEILNYCTIDSCLMIDNKKIDPVRIKYNRSLEDEVFLL